MKSSRWFGFGVLCCLVAACNKTESGPSAGKESASSVSYSAVQAPNESSAPTSDSKPPEAVHAATQSQGAASETPPASFANAKKESISGAVGVGCEAKSAEGWLEFLCRKKNGTGGHPVKAILDAETSEEVVADEQGELRLVLPFRAGSTKDVTIEWSDTRYVLHIADAAAKLEWSTSTLEHRRACAKLLDESKQVIAASHKADAEGRVLPTETKKFPRFGLCQPAGLGSWALALTELTASGEGAARRLRAAIDVVRIDIEGKRLTAPMGTLEFAPGGLEISGLQVYDYDDDGNNELIVPYELTILNGATPAKVANVWSFSDSGVAPYAKVPVLAAGGAGIEQLEFDMRPDVADYGPFVAWFGADCGLSRCPERLTGPRFFFRAMADGSFSREDASPKAALKRACGKKPGAVIAVSGKTLNAAQTAKNVACARAYGVATDALRTELSEQNALLCGESAQCKLRSVLEEWAAASAPIALEP